MEFNVTSCVENETHYERSKMSEKLTMLDAKRGKCSNPFDQLKSRTRARDRRS